MSQRFLRVLSSSVLVVWFSLSGAAPAFAEKFEPLYVIGDQELTYDQLSPEQKASVDQAMEQFSGTGGKQTSLADTVNCFDYYTFNSVQVEVSPVLTSTVAGERISFKGAVRNENPYPVIDATVYAKVFRIPAVDESLLIHRNGYPMVDFFKVADNLKLPTSGSIPLSFDWQVPTYSGGGKYQVVFFVTASERFNLLGLTFTDDVAGNSTEFSVTPAPGVTEPPAFNKYSVKLNDTPYEFAAWPVSFKPNEPVTVSAEVYNPGDKERTVEVRWTLYSWDSLRKENIKDTRKSAVTLKPGESQTVSYQSTSRDHAASYLIAEALYEDAKSVMNIRFTNEGIEQVRLNFPGVSSYPLLAGKENTLFSCVHGVTDLTDNNTLTLTLRQPDGQIIHSYTYQGGITGQMMGVADSFTPEVNYGDFDLVATLNHNGQEIDTVTLKYRCADYPGLDCQGEATQMNLWIKVGLAALVILMAVCGYWLWRRRSLTAATIAPLLLVLMMGLGFAHFSYAASDTDPDQEGDSKEGSGGGPGDEVQRGGMQVWDPESITLINNTFTKSGLAQGTNFWEAYNNFAEARSDVYFRIFVRARYRAQVNKEDGSLLNPGDTINVSLPRTNDDIDWFGGFGYFYDSPYGCWADQQVVWGCATQPLVRTQGGKVGVDLPVLSPTIVGTGAISCDGTTCRATGTATGTIEVRFPSNSARFNFSGVSACAISVSGCTGGGVPLQIRLGTISLPQQTVTFYYYVVGGSNPPATPALTCQNPLLVGGTGTFTFRATDPDNDDLYYQVDWNNDGAVDRRLPTTGLVPSGTAQTTTYSWPTAGTYIVKARAVDETNAMSAWASCSVTITAQPTPPAVDLTANPTTVPIGTASTLSWTVRNATTCFASGGWSGQRPATDGSEPTAALQSRTVFQLSCSGPGGTDQDTAVVNVTNGPPTPTIPPVITPCDNYVNRGDVVCIDWNTTSSPPPSCVLSGPGLAGGAPSAVTGRVNVIIEKESTYRITCPGGIDEATVHILPIIQET